MKVKKYIFKPSRTRVFPGQRVRIGKGKLGVFHVYYLGNDKFTLINREYHEGFGPIAEYPHLIGFDQGIPLSSLYGKDLVGKNNKYKEYWHQDRKVDITVYPRSKT